MCIRDSIVDVEASSEQGDDPAAPRVHRQSFNHRHHKGAPVSWPATGYCAPPWSGPRTTPAGPTRSSRRSTTPRWSSAAPSTWKACCVVAAHLAERLHAVLVRGMPYVVCDTDGSPVDPATAKGDHRRALDRPAQGPGPPAQPQARRRPAGDADTGDQGGEGPAPSPPGTRAVRRARRTARVP